jgi:hypothetical protein
MRAPRCPKCDSAMAEGFTPIETQGWPKVINWVAGAPEKSLWSGLKLRGRQKLAVETWRCPRCGYLESYAPG